MKCLKCQFNNPAESSFCVKCGTPLAGQKADIDPQTKTLETPLKKLSRGTVISGRYEVIEELGKGGMGSVYRVEDKRIHEEVALKLIKPEIAAEKTTLERFNNELKLARRIAHRNVCKMFDLDEEDGRHYITMEYVRGEDLKSTIRRVGPLGTGKAVSIAKQVCEGLTEAHRVGIVHRDLKPGNIMLDRDGNARIMDFGIARSIRAQGITGAGVMIGTPEYMSPEQAEAKEVDQRSDIYSLGVVLYEMVTGRIPFEGETALSVALKHKTEIPPDPKSSNAQVPGDLCRLILKCLEKQKARRYQTVQELFSDLNRIEEGIPTSERIAPKSQAATSKTGTVSFSFKKLFLPPAIVLGVVIIFFLGVWLFGPKKEHLPATIGESSTAITVGEMSIDPGFEDEEFLKRAFIISGDRKPPLRREGLEPVYPQDAKDKKVEGTVILCVRIDEKGLIEDIRVSRTIPLLDQAAVDSIKNWKYEPVIVEGRAVPAVFSVRVRFKLE